jgi:hypothetical protein
VGSGLAAGGGQKCGDRAVVYRIRARLLQGYKKTASYSDAGGFELDRDRAGRSTEDIRF